MIEIKGVIGSKESAADLIIGTTTVYTHHNINKIQNDEAELYQYDEIQYEKNEYIKKLSTELNKANQQVTDLQLALIDMYETIAVASDT